MQAARSPPFFPNDYTDETVLASPKKTLLSASASVGLPAGTYKVGYCIKNKSIAINLTANDYVNGWVMVTN